jgi:hypothetical protein
MFFLLCTQVCYEFRDRPTLPLKEVLLFPTVIVTICRDYIMMVILLGHSLREFGKPSGCEVWWSTP